MDRLAVYYCCFFYSSILVYLKDQIESRIPFAKIAEKDEILR